uniref:Cytosine-specific methyltransferase n=1 Tax=Tetradesmus obliquus TaxID=3088 RepID=A0A383WCP9_TETOB
MASNAELDAWTALGGSIEKKKTGNRETKVFVAPDGKKLKTWKEASEVLKAAGEQDKHARKRGQASPDVAADDKENKKKRQKQQQAATPAAKADTDKPAAADKKPAADKPAAAAADKKPAAAADKKAAAAADKPKATPKSSKKPAAASKRKSAAKEATPEPVKEEEADTAAAAAEEDNEATPMEEDGAAPEQNSDAAEAKAAAAASGRRAASGVKSYKEAKEKKLGRQDEVKAKVEPKAENEGEAVAQTAGEKSSSIRRLLNFAVVDDEGEPQHLDRLELLGKPILLSGSVYPEQGSLSNKETGRQLQKPFGPITSWHVRYSSSSSSAAGPEVVAVTAKASYVLSKPSQAYRKVFAVLEEQAGLAGYVMQAINPEMGGSASASLDAVVAKLARAQAGKGYASAREALLLNGRFVLGQVAAHEARRGGGAKAAADKGKGKAPAGLSSGPFYSELEAELAKGPIQVGLVSGNAIKIRDVQAEGAAAAAAGGSGEPADALAAADEEMARRLQAKMDAQSMGVGKGRGGAAGGRGGAAYIKISEAEIADDYPMPKQYKAPDGVEETDELLLWDEDLADVDPECLPKHLITDFSIYNGEGFFASLELLPLWSGVDPDVELYASGIVKAEEGDWGTGGQPLQIEQQQQQPEAQQAKKDSKKKGKDKEEGKPAAAASGSGAGGSSSGAGGSSKAGGSSSAGGSGSTAAAAAEPAGAEEAAAADAAKEVAVGAGPDPVAEGGMRLYLSQIREWVVEFSADMLFISIRTDAAWYKLCRPNPEYAPWYGVPLKSARVAVALINMLQQESRASRLSFADIVKRLAEVPPGSHTFISKRPERVERYLVVHGQILLNQIKAYPNPAVQKAPFVGSLREKMEARKHSKLYFSKRGFSKAAAVRAVNRNPMKDRAASGRAKPMPATATTMVRAIWQNYFSALEEAGKKDAAAAAAAAAEAAAAEGEVAKEVEDDPLEEEEQEEAGDAQEDALAGGSGPASPKKAKRASRSSKAKGGKEGKAAKAKEAAAAAAEGAAGSSKQAEEAEQKQQKEKKAAAPLKVTWKDAGAAADAEGRTMHRKAQVGTWQLQPGSVVLLEAEAEDEDAQEPPLLFGLVQCMWEDEDGEALAQVRMLAAGRDTVLGDAAAEEQLFLTADYEDIALADISGLGNVVALRREFDHELRVGQFKQDEALRARNAAAKAEGRPLEYFYRHLYLPQQGMFRALPEEQDLQLGTYQAGPADPIELGMLPADKGRGFIKDGVEYKVGDFLYVHTDTFDVEASSEEEEGSDEEDEDKENKAVPAYVKKGRFHKGSCAGLRAWGMARLVEVKEAGSSSRGKDKAAALPAKLRLQRFFRPEDVGKEQAYQAGFWDVYASPAPASASSSEGWVHWVEPDSVICKCCVKAPGADTPAGCEDLDCFEVVGTFNPATKEVSAAPEEFSAASADMQVDGAAAAETDNSLAMATMDIFAGCGGLSEGMHQAGVADTKWAIEYEQPAADAFKLNNPEAAVFCNNCNVILLAAMRKAGLESDCEACDDAKTAAESMSPEDLAALPQPGQVEFIMGGPPCQGYSGMNRFNKGNWSMVQNSMVMSFLSYADFYRPRYFLLENVRNFVSHNKSFTFRLTLRTLLDMGYQVRFGVLNAGNFGVPQSRKRTFIWAAAPDEGLPEWPRPRHVFRSPQLTVNLPGGVSYCAVDTSIPGAPLRTVTVRDAIGDLPNIQNGHDKDPMPYSGPAVSAFQKLMRHKASELRDHICKEMNELNLERCRFICKEMNELNLERCRCIPKDTPGADWRTLLEIVKNDPSREKFNGQPLVPWCLPNTADRHNGWRGLFGRLDLAGHFPTSTTDPQPMGKVGQVFHPNQDRIVSVRECARSQGFPDHFFFSGNVHSRHRQVGNAVPPPLAASLGRQLRKALAATQQKRKATLLW